MQSRGDPLSVKQQGLVLQVAHGISRFCSWLIFMLLLERVQRELGGSLPIAYLILARRLPVLIGAQPGGWLADFFSSKKLLICINLFTGLSSLVLMSLILKGMNSFFVLIFSYSVISFVEGAYKPALSSTLMKIPNANLNSIKKINTGLNSISMLVVILAGLASAFLNLMHSLIPVLVICCVGFVLSSSLVLLVRQKKLLPIQKGAVVLSQTAYSVYALLKLPFIFAILSALIYAFVSLVSVQFPYQLFHNDSFGMGILFFVVGLGVLLGSWIYQNQSFSKSCGPKQIAHFLLMTSLSLLIFVQFTHFVSALVALFCVMIVYSLFKLDLENYVVGVVPAQYVGRSFALISILEESAIGLATLVYAKGFESFGTHVFSLLVGLVISLLSISQLMTSQGHKEKKEKLCLLGTLKDRPVA